MATLREDIDRFELENQIDGILARVHKEEIPLTDATNQIIDLVLKSL